MAVPGLLIEYLVVGALTLAWLFPLLQDRLATIKKSYLPVTFLLLYVLGMGVDYLEWVLTRVPKRWCLEL